MLHTPIATERLDGTESERWFRAIFESDPQCLIILSTDEKLLEINPAGLRIIEAETLEQVIGKEVREFLTLPSQKAWIDGIEKVRQGVAHTWESEIQGLKGTRRWLKGQLVPLRDNGHGFCGVDPEQIFEPFFTTKPDGLGLGLTISRSIVEAHDSRSDGMFVR